MSNWWTSTPPERIQPIPWLAPVVITYLESILQPDFNILEHGSGGSTLWFAKRAQHVTCYENDPDWQAVVKRSAPDNVSVFSQYTLHSWLYDLLLIDGEPIEDRSWWLRKAPDFVKPGGWVVLDNANRPNYARERLDLLKYADLVRSFDGNERPGFLYLITEFYRMKA